MASSRSSAASCTGCGIWASGTNSLSRNVPRIVGEVLGKMHPHGDAAVYDALVRLAQALEHALPAGRWPGQLRQRRRRLAGGDALHRGASLAIAEELLFDIDKNTVDFGPNFDGSYQEPTVLPARLPNLLLNGAAGIAVGMATNIPPHNLDELCDAITLLIDNPEATVEDLIEHHPWAGFPDRRHDPGQRGHRQRLRAPARAASSSAPRRTSRRLPAARTRSSSPSCPTRSTRPAAGAHRRAGQGAQDRRHPRRARRVGPHGHAAGRHPQAGCAAEEGAQPRSSSTPRCRSTFGVNMLALVEGGNQPRVLTLKSVLQELHRAPARGHPPPHRVRAGQARAPRPHPRRPQDRARQPRRGDRARSATRARAIARATT